MLKFQTKSGIEPSLFDAGEGASMVFTPLRLIAFAISPVVGGQKRSQYLYKKCLHIKRQKRGKLLKSCLIFLIL